MDENSVREKILSSKVRSLHGPEGEAWSSPYAPVYVSVLIPGEPVTFDLYLKGAAKEGQGFEFLPFLKWGEAWKHQWLELLTKKGIDRLYFHNEDLERVIAYLNNYLQLLKHQGTKVSQELLTVFSEHLNLSIRRAFQSPRLGPAVKKAQSQVEDLIERLQQDPPSIKLVWKILYHNYSLYNHSLNLCLLGTAFMLFLKKSGKETRDMGLAGLFHDIGMIRVPQEIILKEGLLTPEERTEIKHHPGMGHRLLSKGPSLAYVPNEVLSLAREHHENADGSGYPRGLPLSRQHPWTRIIRLLDSYDSLTNNRPYRGAYKPFHALKILQESHGPRGPIYDPHTLKDFISFLTAD